MICQSFVLVLAMSLSPGVSYPSLLSLSNALICDIFSHLRQPHCWMSFDIQYKCIQQQLIEKSTDPCRNQCDDVRRAPRPPVLSVVAHSPAALDMF